MGTLYIDGRSWRIYPLTFHPSPIALSLFHHGLAYWHSWYTLSMLPPCCPGTCHCSYFSHTYPSCRWSHNSFLLLIQVSSLVLREALLISWFKMPICPLSSSLLLNLVLLHSLYHFQCNVCLSAYFPGYKFQEDRDTFFFFFWGSLHILRTKHGVWYISIFYKCFQKHWLISSQTSCLWWLSKASAESSEPLPSTVCIAFCALNIADV